MPRACPVEIHVGCYCDLQCSGKERETPPRKAAASSKLIDPAQPFAWFSAHSRIKQRLEV